MSRAERRHQKFRIRERARRIMRLWGTANFDNVVRCAENLCTCSGYCCGNPRKWFGEKTLQEKRADESMVE